MVLTPKSEYQIQITAADTLQMSSTKSCVARLLRLRRRYISTKAKLWKTYFRFTAKLVSTTLALNAGIRLARLKHLTISHTLGKHDFIFLIIDVEKNPYGPEILEIELVSVLASDSWLLAMESSRTRDGYWHVR